MNTYLLIDTMNTFFRAKHVVRGDIDTKVGMAMHIVMSSVRKAWKEFNGTHVVFNLEGHSWRKDFYRPYKANRKEARNALTPHEVEEDQLFFEIYNEFVDFIETKTNCTTLVHPNLEADDLIAGWVQNHPDDQHIIISTDGDFAQLVAPNVKQYNGVSGVTTTIDGYFDDNNKPVVEKKTKKTMAAPDPSWLLFEKCMRGDKSDNVFSAYPGARTKGTKNKVGLIEAFEDKDSKGYNWNNLMLQRWIDHNEKEHRVLDDYNRNVTLCDLTAQPDEVRKQIDNTTTQVPTKNITQVGMRLMKFCAKWDLQRISNEAQSFAAPLNAKYPGKEHHTI